MLGKFFNITGFISCIEYFMLLIKIFGNNNKIKSGIVILFTLRIVFMSFKNNPIHCLN